MYLATDFVCRRIPLWVDRLEHAVGRGSDSKAAKIVRDAKNRDYLKTVSPEVRESTLCDIERDAGVSFDSFEGDRAVYAPLTRDELIEMAGHGVSFGAHTRSHPILATQTEKEQKEETDGSRRDIESLGITVSPIFAYPNGQPGDWNSATEKVLEVGGFTHALTTLAGVNNYHTHPFRLRRYALDATEDMAAFANIVSGVRLFLKSLL
jgi:peptidoglycan/xylan/chitin deacetylase (PgdA/CDA1 family)